MKFDIYEAEDGWRWSIHARNGQNMANGGEAYQRPQKLLNALNKYIVRGDPEMTVALEKALALEGLTLTGTKIK